MQVSFLPESHNENKNDFIKALIFRPEYHTDNKNYLIKTLTLKPFRGCCVTQTSFVAGSKYMYAIEMPWYETQ